ncbi:MAG: CHAD domain-containing protein [Ignavibacteria bacterium]|nr:CHAD domain-containing protein [Ignavibacteria bacterium]
MAKARKIPFLNPNKPVKSCVQKILRVRFDEMISFEEGTIEGKDIEALHDMRVAARRLQAVMKIFRQLFPKKSFRKVYNELRLLIRALGEVRDYDVFIDKIENMVNTTEYDKRALNLLLIRKKAERDEKRKILVSLINELNKRGYKEHFYRFIFSQI